MATLSPKSWRSITHAAASGTKRMGRWRLRAGAIAVAMGVLAGMAAFLITRRTVGLMKWGNKPAAANT